MNVLHYSFSLSACPKCHLLVCKHTSLAELDFRPIEQQPPPPQPVVECTRTTNNHVKYPYQRLSSHGINFYLLPQTEISSNNRHSWTTFGTGSIESNITHDREAPLADTFSIDNETLCDNIPFASEIIVQSSLPPSPGLTQKLVRTQSERWNTNVQPRVVLTRSFSFSTICTPPNSSTLTSSSSPPRIKQEHPTQTSSYSHLSILIIIILIVSFLLTNTIDIVLLYIYYNTNRWILFIIIAITIACCDLFLWLNHLIRWKDNDGLSSSSRLLRIPFIIRLYLLFQLVELMIVIFHKNIDDNDTKQILHPTSTPSSSTTTTLETRTTDSSILHNHSSSFKTMKRRLFHSLALFYLVHSSLLGVVNLYFWSNDFQSSNKSLMTMNDFVPRWISNNDISSSTTLPSSITFNPKPKFDIERKYFARRTMSTNWTRSSLTPLLIRLPSSSTFILTSILYHLIIDYSLLSTFLVLRRSPLIIILSTISRFCLLITRLYTFIFLLRLDAWWFSITFCIVHFTLMTSLLIDRSKTNRHCSSSIIVQLILSLITHHPGDDVSMCALISLENISIFLHRLYLETFSSSSLLNHDTTSRLIIFISILVSLQILGFLLDILSKNGVTCRTNTIAKV